MKICSRMPFGLLLKVATLVVLHGTNNPNHFVAAKVVLRGSLSQENHLNELREKQERRRLQDVAVSEAPSTTSEEGTTEVTLDKDDEPSNEDPPDEDPVDEEAPDEDPVDEEAPDEDPVDEEAPNEDPPDEDPPDEDLQDEDLQDEDLQDEDPPDEDLQDEDPPDEDPPDEDLQDEDPPNVDPPDEDTTETTPDPTPAPTVEGQTAAPATPAPTASPAPTVEGQTAAPTMEPSTSPTVSEVIIIRPPPPAQLRNPLLNRPVYATNNGPSQLKYLKTNIIRPSISIPVDRQRTIPRETINRLPPYLISQSGGFARLGEINV